LLKKKPEAILPKKAYFLFTMDIEMGRLKPEQVNKNVSSTIKMLENFGRGSFLIDGEVIEKTKLPDISKHEIGCHGYKHSAVGNDWWIGKADRKYNPKFAVSKGTKLIKDHFNIKPVSFRAPKFSISNETVGILKRQGYKIDSSITPHSDVLFPYKLNGLFEMPVSRVPKPKLMLKRGIPQFYFYKLMPLTLGNLGIKKFIDVSKEILYYWGKKPYPMLLLVSHPWEIDKKMLNLMGDYFASLEKAIKVEFISMKDYYRKTRE